MERTWLAAGAISMFIVVAAGAFGAHWLKSRLSPEMFAIFEVAVRYQAYHALALLAVGLLAARQGGGAVEIAGYAFVLGTLLFSGSLYLLALTGARGFGAITPIGGVFFLAGWLVLIWSALVTVPYASSLTYPPR